MKRREIRIAYDEAKDLAELAPEMAELIREARKIAEKAYSPSTKLSVRAAVKLPNRIIFTGNNQENAAYPSGLCAERTALFYASANHPDVPVEVIAISARNSRGLVTEPVKPCGSCLQVLLETEIRFRNPIKIILDGENSILLINGIDSLLPLSFKPSSLE